MENTLDSAIEKVLDDMRNITREEFQAEIAKYMASTPQERKFDIGQEVVVDFALGSALGSAVVIIKTFHWMQDGSIIYHVMDKETGHEDFVGQQFIKQL